MGKSLMHLKSGDAVIYIDNGKEYPAVFRSYTLPVEDEKNPELTIDLAYFDEDHKDAEAPNEERTVVKHVPNPDFNKDEEEVPFYDPETGEPNTGNTRMIRVEEVDETPLETGADGRTHKCSGVPHVDHSMSKLHNRFWRLPS